LVTAEDRLLAVFLHEAACLGMNPADAERLFNLLPAAVQSAPAVKFSPGPEWRYRFGAPFHLDGKAAGFEIPYQAPLVANLVRAARVAGRALTDPHLRRSWLQQVDKPAKHLDAVVEMLAVANVTPDRSLIYEYKGFVAGSQRIDWLLKTQAEGYFLLEVKNRPGQAAQELIQSEPGPDFEALFKSTAGKFMPISRSAYTQGVLLFVNVKLPGARLASFFREHLQTHLHFVALAKEDPAAGLRVDLLAASPQIAGRVLSAFGWREGADLIEIES
jgi:hypothetical protein